jgi:hypothetical protein
MEAKRSKVPVFSSGYSENSQVRRIAPNLLIAGKLEPMPEMELYGD